jgi:hypothetical protein
MPGKASNNQERREEKRYYFFIKGVITFQAKLYRLCLLISYPETRRKGA